MANGPGNGELYFENELHIESIVEIYQGKNVLKQNGPFSLNSSKNRSNFRSFCAAPSEKRS
jgi:hypothetical protein